MQKLIFVYNANSGFKNMVIDVAHKIFSPKTYACHLCALTFDTFSENKSWKTFREDSKIDMAFLHIDEFENRYKNQSFSYPIILTETENKLNIFLTTAEINKIDSVEKLVLAIKKSGFFPVNG